MTWQVAGVKKNLASDDRMVSTHNRVVFDSSGSYIENKGTGQRTQMRRNGRLTEFDIWVKKDRNVNGVTKETENDDPTEGTYETHPFTRLVDRF